MVEKFNYTEVQNDADELIQEFGFEDTEAFIVRLVEDTTIRFDKKPTNLSQYVINAVRLNLNRTDRDNAMTAGLTEIAKYSKIIVSGKSVSEIKTGDYIILNSDQYQVLYFKSVKPYDTVIIHSCIVQKTTSAPSVSVIAQEDGLILTQEDGKAIGVVI